MARGIRQKDRLSRFTALSNAYIELQDGSLAAAREVGLSRHTCAISVTSEAIHRA